MVTEVLGLVLVYVCCECVLLVTVIVVVPRGPCGLRVVVGEVVLDTVVGCLDVQCGFWVCASEVVVPAFVFGGGLFGCMMTMR